MKGQMPCAGKWEVEPRYPVEWGVVKAELAYAFTDFRRKHQLVTAG